ncbi:MAG: phosphatase PAP2 family protein [Sphingomonadales bacterium]|nr:phosphatase PAP2 family protein [Sphingomonadales bacterium]
MTAAPDPGISAGLPMPAESPELHFLAATDVLPQRVLPLPPARGSEREHRELQTLHAMITAATPERLARAASDSAHEDPSIFSEALGRDLTRLPKTWSLLVSVQDEVEAAVILSKDAFGRLRPYGVDATMPTCVKVNRDKPARAYPSGHAGLGWGVGWFLVRLVPDMAPAILNRADEYAQSRQLCGVHFPSDTEASHMLGTVVAERLLNDPRLADRIAAARTELAAAQ